MFSLGKEVGSGQLAPSDGVEWVNATLGGRYHKGRGANELFQGHIGEVLFYDRALSDTERNAVRSYLTGRWEPTGVFPLSETKQKKKK